MRFLYPGRFALPATLLLAGVAVTAARFGVINAAHYSSYFALGLIASGLEELYFWARSKAGR